MAGVYPAGRSGYPNLDGQASGFDMSSKPKSILDDYYSEEEMSSLLAKKLVTLGKERCLEIGPPARKVGSRWLYPRKEFELWVYAQPLKWGKRARLQKGR